MFIEEALLALLFVYVSIFLLLGATKGRKWLKGYSSKSSKYLFHSVEVVLTLAGLAITALALFIGFGLQNLGQLSSIIQFFSISFVTLTLSAVFVRYPRRVYRFMADILADTGILAIGCGFLAFSGSHLQNYVGIVLTYGTFIVVFVLLSSINFHKYYKYWTSLVEETDSGDKTTRERDNVQLWISGIMLGVFGNMLVSACVEIVNSSGFKQSLWTVVLALSWIFFMGTISQAARVFVISTRGIRIITYAFLALIVVWALIVHFGLPLLIS